MGKWGIDLALPGQCPAEIVCLEGWSAILEISYKYCFRDDHLEIKKRYDSYKTKSLLVNSYFERSLFDYM